MPSTFASAVWACLVASGAAGCGTEHEFRTKDGEPNNVVIAGGYAYASVGAAGVRVIDLDGGAVVGDVPPPGRTGGVHDLAVADGLLFVLDADPPGFLSMLALADPTSPSLIDGPVAVAVGGFSGIDARGGRVVVAGGSEAASVRTYNQGTLGENAVTASFGRDQVAVGLRADAAVAFVSTHFFAEDEAAVQAPYGLTSVALEEGAPSPIDRVGIADAGYTPGNASPANFALQSAHDAGVVVVAHGGGLTVLDADDAGRLTPRGSVDLDLHATAVALDAGLAFVVGVEPSAALVVVDTRTLGIVQRWRFPPGAFPTGIDVSADHMVIAAGLAGVVVQRR